MKMTSTTAAKARARIANRAKKDFRALVVSLDSITAAIDDAPRAVFIPADDTVENRCNMYQAHLGALAASSDLIAVVEKYTGADFSEPKERIKAATQENNDKSEANQCSKPKPPE
jgi:hypothetical protein